LEGSTLFKKRMCLIGIAIEQNEKYPFVLCSNRDEFINRPSNQPDSKEEILCGKDEFSKGTWIGINKKNGDFSALTNIEVKI
jgi:uncharacterized protein with NRDE domain